MAGDKELIDDVPRREAEEPGQSEAELIEVPPHIISLGDREARDAALLSSDLQAARLRGSHGLDYPRTGERHEVPGYEAPEEDVTQR